MDNKAEKINHDQLFKTLIKEFFEEFMMLFLPEVGSEIDFKQVEFLEQEFFTDINHGRKKLLDLVAKVKLLNGDEEYILIHSEFESRKPNSKEFPQRMFKYFCQLFLRFGKPIIPIVIFTDDHKWRSMVPDTFRLEFKDKEYLKYCYHSIKLKHYNWRDFLNHHNPLAYALMSKMDYSNSERVRVKADFLRLILQAEINPARQSILVDFVENYVRLNSKEQQLFEATVKAEEIQEVIKMMTVYEARGIEKGMQQGMQQGVSRAILETLEVRFGNIPYILKEKINYCNDLEKLNRAHKKALLISSLDEFKL